MATAVCGAIGISLGAGDLTTASAATYTTAKYLTYGTTTTGSSTSSGCPSNFNIYMHGSSTSGTGTMYHDKLIDWSYVYIKIEPSSISDHLSFKLTKNDYTYTNKSLSGNDDLTLFSGALSDGEYELEYKGRYRKNIFYSYTTYTYTYRFEVDKTAPSYTLKAGGYNISSGSYTNKQVVYTASDTNFDAIRYLKPTASSYYTTYSTSYTVAATDANNGWWYMYARDDLGTTNSTVRFYMDTIKPVGKVTSNGSTIVNGGYTNNSFYYTATDTGGVSYLQYKTPTSSSWSSYTSGTTISGTNGWYTFRAVDKAGNISDEYKVCYDTSIPSATLYSGNSSVSNGYYSNADFVKFFVSDSISGIKAAYVKLPGNSYYSSYTSDNQLTTEGTYTFYAVNNAGLSTAYYTITLDRTKAYGTLYADNNIVSSGTYTNANSVRFYSYDSVSGVATTYVMKPNTTSYVAYTSGTALTDVGEYKFYCVDCCGNQSDIYTVTIDRNAPSAQLYVDDEPVSNNSYTNDGHIRFETVDDNLQGCYVKLPDSEEFIDYVSGTEFYKAGKYVFYAIDESGLSTGEYSIVIDRESKPLTLNNVVDGSTNGNVTITWTDGDSVDYKFGEIISEAGKYTAIMSDKLGNTATVNFTIVAPISQSFFHNFDNLTGFEKVTVNEVDTRLNYGDLTLNESGVYNVSVYINGQAYPFTLTIDSTAPTATLSGVENGGQTKGSVTVSDLSETATVEVLLNDEPIEYELGEELTEVGKYLVVITDELGNTTEYTFEILYSLNATAIILIIIGILLVAGTVTTIIVMRKKGKFSKKKA